MTPNDPTKQLWDAVRKDMNKKQEKSPFNLIDERRRLMPVDGKPEKRHEPKSKYGMPKRSK